VNDVHVDVNTVHVDVNVVRIFPQALPNRPAMSDEKQQISSRIETEVYDELCDELSSFNSDSARVQFLVQFYLDYKELGHRD
jgi:hypothetical protein